MTVQKNTHVAAQAFKILRALYQLSTELYDSENRQELIFRILNSTTNIFPYRRAVLWSLAGRKAVPLGISGRETVNPRSPIAELWGPVVRTIKDSASILIINDAPNGCESAWAELQKKTSGLSVMWVPIVSNGKIQAGFWIERWGNDTWDATEREIMSSYAKNLHLAWDKFAPAQTFNRWKTIAAHKATWCVAVILLACFAMMPIVSLRVVAPCEVVPEHPEVVTAPLDGVIKSVIVKPGDVVKKGDLLFSYEDKIVLQELKVAQKQVEIIKTQYDRMRFKSFIDEDAMQEIQSVKLRLEQEQIRLALAESNVSHLTIRSMLDGVCMVDHPESWQGRPVQIGERVLMIFDPGRSKIRILLPEKDNIDFDPDKPVAVILNALPAERYHARLNYVAPQTSEGPDGRSGFLAEAAWLRIDSGVKVGSRGTAIVYGDKVSIMYWLLRKPMAAFRQLTGL